MRRMAVGSKTGRTTAIGAVAVTVVLLGGFVLASIPHTDGAIYACYKKGSGQLRVIDPAVEQCSSSERPLRWNQAGPPPTTTPGTGAGFADIVGGSTDSLDPNNENNAGLFGWHSLGIRGWSRLPVAGTLGDFHVGLLIPPSGITEQDRNLESGYTFTVMCKRPGGPASSCNGLGPGPVATPLSCTIRQSDYASEPNLANVVPECSHPSTFRFAAGEWITVRVQPFGGAKAQGGNLSAGNKMQWQASYTR